MAEEDREGGCAGRKSKRCVKSCHKAGYRDEPSQDNPLLPVLPEAWLNPKVQALGNGELFSFKINIQ